MLKITIEMSEEVYHFVFTGLVQEILLEIFQKSLEISLESIHRYFPKYLSNVTEVFLEIFRNFLK